ncbi:MAG: major facilitator superfamily domain-containing protein 1 [bacterium]|nr:major facilitator superfamily domain-containing protein 1 [bacterium]
MFISYFLFSAVPGKIANKKQKIVFLAILFALFTAYICEINTQLQLWLQNGPKTTSLILVVTILFAPIFGDFIDKKGKAASLMVIGSLLLIFAHASLSLSNNIYLAYMGLLSFGVAFSMVSAAIWASVAKIIPESHLGTAYASMFTLQNWGLGLFFWGIGALLDFANRENIDAIRSGEANYDYTIPIYMLMISGIISVFLAVGLKRADLKQGYGLELPSGAVAPNGGSKN